MYHYVMMTYFELIQDFKTNRKRLLAEIVPQLVQGFEFQRMSPIFEFHFILSKWVISVTCPHILMTAHIPSETGEIDDSYQS
ncbi:unnamed protein product [Heterobilharzia americana]|nr:unnamed protein product [Heterobilharzia americana]